MVLARLEGAESGLIVKKPISSVVFQFGGALLVQAELCFSFSFNRASTRVTPLKTTKQSAVSQYCQSVTRVDSDCTWVRSRLKHKSDPSCKEMTLNHTNKSSLAFLFRDADRWFWKVFFSNLRLLDLDKHII